MKVINKFLILLTLLFSTVISLSCQTKAEKQLENLFSDNKYPFTNVLNEGPEIKKLILQNKKAFLKDLEFILSKNTDDLFIIADKKHFLQQTYVPKDLVSLQENNVYLINRKDLSLREPVEKALKIMAENAKLEGINLLVSSTYRSYDYQKIVYERNVRLSGQEIADRESAKPGTSQHQLGTVIDFGSITDEYAQTKAGKWLYNNAEKYGWSLSFPQGYESVTGYRWECWHYRYIGKEACAFQKKWFNNIQQYMIEFLNSWIIENQKE